MPISIAPCSCLAAGISRFVEVRKISAFMGRQPPLVKAGFGTSGGRGAPTADITGPHAVAIRAFGKDAKLVGCNDNDPSTDLAAIRDRTEALRGINIYLGDGATLVRSMVRHRDHTLIGHASSPHNSNGVARRA
jgi:hypothetical protein